MQPRARRNLLLKSPNCRQRSAKDDPVTSTHRRSHNFVAHWVLSKDLDFLHKDLDFLHAVRGDAVDLESAIGSGCLTLSTIIT